MENKIIKYHKHKNFYIYVIYKLLNGFEIPQEKGIIKELPKEIKLNYNNTF